MFVSWREWRSKFDESTTTVRRKRRADDLENVRNISTRENLLQIEDNLEHELKSEGETKHIHVHTCSEGQQQGDSPGIA